jgi:hypothetical protein
MPGDGVRRDDLSFLEQLVWAGLVAQGLNTIRDSASAMQSVWTAADLLIERLRDEDHRRAIERTAPKKSARAVDGEQREGTATTSIADSSAGLDSAPVHGEAGSRGPRTILEDIGFLPKRNGGDDA